MNQLAAISDLAGAVAWRRVPPAMERNRTAKSFSPGTNRSAKRILDLVEDEFFIALDAQAQVEALGHTVVGIAVSADEAVTMAEREKPDLVLMDIRLSWRPRRHRGRSSRYASGYGSRKHFRDREHGSRPHCSAPRSINPLGVLHKPLTQAGLLHQLSKIKWE